MDYIIRVAQVTDLPFIWPSLPMLRQELFQCVIERELPRATGLPFASTSILPLNETVTNSLCLITEIADQIEGILILRGNRYRERQHVSLLDLIYLNPKWRNQGIGTAMLAQAIEWSRRKGIATQRIQAVVTLNNEGLTRLLKHSGFQSEGILKNYARIEGEIVHVEVFALLI